MEISENFLAPCGLYCGVCGVYIAMRDNNTDFLERLLGVYQSNIPGLDHLTVKDLECDGCLSDRKSVFCLYCSIRDCVKVKGYDGCHQCAEFPCEHIEKFPMPVGKKVILRAIPYWREHGTEKWVRDEEARYLCPVCGHAMFRGAKRCHKCKTSVDLD
jgi:hypothetical protein